MSLPRSARAVVFDMDGLLVDTETVMLAAMEGASAALGNPLPFSTFQRMIGLTHAQSDRILEEHFGEGFVLEDYLADVRARVMVSFEAGVALKAGVLELLDHLDAIGMPRAICTSSSRAAVDLHLGPSGVVPRFEHFITKDVVTNGKPHPEPYLLAAKALGLEPRDCLALEDSHNGVRSASSAGMMTIMVPDLLEPTDEMHGLCVRIARDLHEVRGLLAG